MTQQNTALATRATRRQAGHRQWPIQQDTYRPAFCEALKFTFRETVCPYLVELRSHSYRHKFEIHPKTMHTRIKAARRRGIHRAWKPFAGTRQRQTMYLWC